MSLTAAQVQFAAEFITLVVTAAALALLVLRPPESSSGHASPRPSAARRPPGSTLLAAVALVVLGAASFVHGSLLVSGHPVVWVGLGRVAAAAAVLLIFPYPGGPRAGRTPIGGLLLRFGFLSWLVAGAAEMARAPGYLIDGLLVGGSVLVAAALLRVAQRSIAVRVASSGAATLLLVVVVLALALSQVISSSAQNEELSRLLAQSKAEVAALGDTAPLAFAAQVVQTDLASYPFANRSALADYANGTEAQQLAASVQIIQRMSVFARSTGNDSYGSISYYEPSGRSFLSPNGSPFGTRTPPGSKDPVLDVSCAQPASGRQGLFLFAAAASLEASSPECSGRSLLGVVVVSRLLTGSMLTRSLDPAQAVHLALVADGQVIGADQLSAPTALAVMAGARIPPVGVILPQVSGDRFVSVAAVPALSLKGETPLYVVVTSPATAVVSTREQLFRTLFLVAFGGTVIALGLAVFTGDRITARLRRLTGTAAAVQAGETAVRAAVPGDDEVASVGSAFDSMLDSVSAQSAALLAAAEDEARLRNRLEAVVGGMTDALVAVDLEGRVTDFNRAAADLTGVDAHRALGAPVEQVVRLRDEEGRPVGPRMFRAGARDQAMLGQVVGPAGDVPVAVSSGALRDPGGAPAGTVLVFRDMRREHEVEQMKTEFLSRVGHELRTPLTGIMGYADILLRRDVPPERARSWHEEILHSARRLLRIVEMLEFFASDGAGRLVLRPEPLDARALVNGIASSWAERLPANLTIGRRMARSETTVSADRRWLSLAVDELIDNAVKFSPEGGRIAVRVAERAGCVEIAVSDQGMGMTAQQYQVIFGDFVQADNSDTRRFGGLGLGLAVVRRVVEGHGGTIRGRSAPGRGTTFVIELPAWPEVAKPASGRPRRNGKEPEAAAPGDPGRGRPAPGGSPTGPGGAS